MTLVDTLISERRDLGNSSTEGLNAGRSRIVCLMRHARRLGCEAPATRHDELGEGHVTTLVTGSVMTTVRGTGSSHDPATAVLSRVR